MHDTAAATFSLPPRESKPRHKGITAVIDYGPDGFGWTGERGVADLLICAADYIDFAKIYALNALLMPEDVVKRIVRLYRDADVVCYSGGILFEYAYQRNQLDLYAAHIKRLGFGALEISENYIELGDSERLSLVDRFQSHGLSVIYEFGRKNPEHPMRVQELGTLIASMKNVGVEHVIIEQSEIDMAAKSDPDALKELANSAWFGNILIETDPYRFPSQHVGMLQDFGVNVNLANVAPGQALRLEGLRRGIGRAVNYSIIA
jgi:phosphosulfolactate synthase